MCCTVLFVLHHVVLRQRSVSYADDYTFSPEAEVIVDVEVDDC